MEEPLIPNQLTVVRPCPALPLPLCNQCHKPVDRLVYYYDHDVDEWVLIAKCHGKSERVTMTAEILESCDTGTISMGDAFKAIPELT